MKRYTGCLGVRWLWELSCSAWSEEHGVKQSLKELSLTGNLTVCTGFRRLQ